MTTRKHRSARERASRTRDAWAVLFRSENRLDGYREHLLGAHDHPCRTKLFDSRREARNFIAERFAFIKTRRDLRTEPFGWKRPIAVRVAIQVIEHEGQR